MKYFITALCMVVCVAGVGSGVEQVWADQKPSQEKEVSALISEIKLLNTALTGDTAEADLLKSLLVDRKKAMLKLAALDPREFLALTRSSQLSAKVVPSLRDEFEKEVTVNGKMTVIYAENVQNHDDSQLEYRINVGTDEVLLHTTEPLPYTSGATVRVKGSRIDDTLVAYAEHVEQVAAAPALDSVGEQVMRIVMVEPLGAGPQPITAAELAETTFNGPLQKFYREQSYGKVSFSGTAHGWYTLPSKDACQTFNRLSPEFQDIIAKNNISLTGVDRLVVVVNGFCSPSARATVGKSNFSINGETYNLSVAWISAYSDMFTIQTVQPFQWRPWDAVLTHEIGHNLGVMHAGGWDCRQEAETLYGDGCTHLEYGDYFDNMGEGLYALHFNAFFKEKLGWVKANEVLKITESGRYTIQTFNPASDEPPLSSSATSSSLSASQTSSARIRVTPKKFAKIQLPSSNQAPFYLEYRKGEGFDRRLNIPLVKANQQGLFVRQVVPAGQPFTRLLDIQPTNQFWPEDVAAVTLNAPQAVFRDDGRGVTIGPVVSSTNSSITFDVQINPVACERAAPVLSKPTVSDALIPSATGYISLEFSNPDTVSCGGSQFAVTSSLPSSWNASLQPKGSLYVDPGQASTQYQSINFVVPPTTKPGDYPFTVTVENLTSGDEVSREVLVRVFDRPVIEEVTPVSGPVGSVVTLSGQHLVSSESVAVMISGAQGCRLLSGKKMGNGAVSVVVPETLRGYTCGCTFETPTGPYTFTVLVYGGSSEASPVFEVTASASKAPAKKIKGSPTDTLSPVMSQPLQAASAAFVAYINFVERILGFNG